MSLLEEAKRAALRLNFNFPYNIEAWLNEMNMLMENYHKHTTWSDLIQIDSATDIHEFMEHSNSYGCQCYFSGEHGYPGEWLYVYDVCKNSQDADYRKKHKLSKEIKFRYSAEVYWVKDINEVIREEYVDKKGKPQVSEKRDKTNCHMVIVARTYQAMRKLNYIITCAHNEGFYSKPRIDLNMLFEIDKDDVYITSACIAGWKYENAEDIWLKIWEHFGNNFFLEYQTHNTMAQKLLNDRIYKMSQKYGIQTIVGLDTHYINEEDRIKRENLLQRKGLHYDDENGWYMDFPTGKKTYERLVEQAVLPSEEIIYSMMNTHVFIGGCEELTYKTNFKIPIAPMYEKYNYDERVTILKDILHEKYGEEDLDHRTKDREEGMLYEHGEIEASGTTDYFLTNFELVKLAVNKHRGQLTTTSRGSASSYYSSKLLGFTTMDRFESEVPIYPERFITKDRILSSHQMPD